MSAMDPEILTPAVRTKPVFPRWARWFIAPLLLLSVVTAVVGPSILDVLAAFLLPFAAVGAVAISMWLESRLYFASLGLPSLVRVSIAVIVPPVSLAIGLVGFALLSTLVGIASEDLGGLALAVLLLAVVWFSAAALGSAVVLGIDLLAGHLAGSFRARLMIAFASLNIIAVLVTTAISLAVLGASDLLRNPEVAAQTVTVDIAANDPEVARLIDGVIAFSERPVLVVLFSLGLTFVLALPSFLSATSKLADAAMERIHPLHFAFDALARGRRDIRLEEAGSSDFVRMSRSFNRMVEALALSERMERAFGLYVSGHVLDRIRQQHGEAVIPAALREASVFFADIRGFTSMSERLSPEQVVGVLNRWFERVVGLVERHDGYLNKFIGDAVVVVFNGPIDQPDHAARACRCAIALQEEVSRLNAEHAFPEIGELAVGVGVATGPMVCGNVGGTQQMEYTVIGDTVNLSSRLTSRAAKGEVLASEATARALPADQPATRLDAIPVKGKEQPIVPYRVWPRPS